MVHLVENEQSQALPGNTWMRDAQSSFDVVAKLEAALAPRWTVQREVDPSGELAVIVLPTGDDIETPAFALYEQDGMVQVVTIAGETWQGRQVFSTCQRAVAAIVAASLRASACLG